MELAFDHRGTVKNNLTERPSWYSPIYIPDSQTKAGPENPGAKEVESRQVERDGKEVGTDDAGKAGEDDSRTPSDSRISKLELSQYLTDLLQNNDRNSDNILSLEEFQQGRHNNNDSDRSAELGDFVERHFGTLSILHADGIFSEGGVSSGDIRNLQGDVTEKAHSSYQARFGNVGKTLGTSVGVTTGVGAQAADFYFTGGSLTTISTMGHMLAGGIAAYVFETPEAAALPLAGILIGSTWGPSWGAYLGSQGGEWLGRRISSTYFERTHAPRINALLSEIKPATR